MTMGTRGSGSGSAALRRAFDVEVLVNRLSSLTLVGLFVCASLAAARSHAADAASAAVILDMDTVRHRPTDVTTADGQKVPAGTAELVDGKFGKAVRFDFIEGARSGFMAASVPGGPAWDAAEGFSFWVKGDGSRNWGGIELIDKDDFGLRYAYCFPIESAEWTKVTVAWRDLTPELAGPMVDPKGGYAPSKFGSIWFGKWHYWRDYPAHSFAVDHVALEAKVARDKSDYEPKQASLRRVLEKLKAKKPVTVVTMGDSLSDKRHWANRQTLWSELLAARLKTAYGAEVTLVNPALGGTTLSQNMVLVPRWLREHPEPDLIVVWFGGNDWDNGVRRVRFCTYLEEAVDRLRRETKGKSDILLMTTGPSHGRWQETAELEQAVRDVGARRKVPVADVAAEFRKAGGPDEALGQGYWVDDKVHLGPKGHEVVADLVQRTIEK
jgi:lysophospholipase L1-like esterase